MEGLFGGVEFPDGTLAIDHIEELVDCQKVFMEVVSETRTANMFTYPVLTYSLLKRKDLTKEEIQEMIKTKNWNIFVDKEFSRWCSDHNVEWNDSNFFCSDDVGVLSNCPVSGDTDILYYSDYYNRWFRAPIKEVYYDAQRNGKKSLKMLSNGEPINVRINKFDSPIEYKISLQNGAELKTTANHLNKAYGRDYVKSADLTTNDYLPYSRRAYENSTNLTYKEGFLVGMFLGDGSYRNTNDIVYSLSEAKSELIDFLHEYCPKKFGGIVKNSALISSLSGKQSCTNVSIVSKYLRGLIEQFVTGNSALDKGINGKALEQSVEFREGIIDGLYATDGGNSGRIYTSSKNLKDDLIVICSSLGRVTTISSDTREGRLGKNPCYTVRLYSKDTYKQSQKNVYIKDDDYFWVKVKSIEKIENGPKVSYCVEVIGDNHEPIFTLGNGIVTHNCRLLSDTTKLDAFINSIGGTALSVGSCRVSTINLVRIAYESKFDKKKYIKILKDRVLLDCKALTSMRHIIKRNIEKGLLPNYQDGAVELDKQFCTIGGIGMYEVMDLFGLIDTDDFGNKSYSDEAVDFATKILNTMNEIKDTFDCDFSFNIEMIPAENCAGVICQADNLLFEQNKYFIYSNQWIPLMEPCTIQEKCRLGSLFDEKCGGGCIAHINVENRFPNKDVAWDMLNYVAAQGVIYFAFTTKISVCKHRHAFIGTNTCPKCGEPIADTYSRVVGFYTPVSNYQSIRKKEFDKRRWYDVLNKDGII